MLKSTVRFLPGVVASMLLLAGMPQAVAAAAPGWEESGQASWYGGGHHGRRTSSGEAFDQNAMTAAHSSLPLGSRVRVTLQDTGESVVVEITDRQPPKGLRVIDLSRGAASRLGIVSRGTGMVTLSPAGLDQVTEVAEAADDAADFGDAIPRRRGLRRMRHARPVASAARPCCRAPSVIQVRHSAQRRAAPRRL